MFKVAQIVSQKRTAVIFLIRLIRMTAFLIPDKIRERYGRL